MDVEQLAHVITARTGVELVRGGLRDALEFYYEKRIHDLGLVRSEDYIRLLEDPGGEELERLIEIISVPHTWFFRDREQLDLVGDLIATLSRKRQVINIWIPGCATGEDVYSVALIAASRGLSTRITGSDLCEQSLSMARRRLYSPFSLRALPPEFRGHFRQVGRSFEIAPVENQQISFQCHNLLEPALSTPGGWDLILCRNVFIYFSKTTASDCAARMGHQLHENGSILFGAGELIGTLVDGLLPQTEKNRVLFRKTRWPVRETDTLQLQSPPVIPDHEKRSRVLSVIPTFNFSNAKLVDTPPPTDEVLEETDEALSNASAAPMDPHLRMMAGIALYTAGDLERSLHELRAASLLDGTLWLAAVFQGMCLESMGRPDLARTEYRHVVRVLEDNPEYHAKLPCELEGFGPDLLAMARKKSA